MQQVTHQTVRLEKGKHRFPADGACVMELASMLAGERFTDHPHSVDKTIAALLRTYNDLVDDDRRQDLYEYAAKVVGTGGAAGLEKLRVERIAVWTDEVLERRRWAFLQRLARRLGRGLSRGPTHLTPEATARRALSAPGRLRDENHAAILALVDELIAIGAPEPSECPGEPVRRSSVAQGNLVGAQ